LGLKNFHPSKCSIAFHEGMLGQYVGLNHCKITEFTMFEKNSKSTPSVAEIALIFFSKLDQEVFFCKPSNTVFKN